MIFQHLTFLRTHVGLWYLLSCCLSVCNLGQDANDNADYVVDRTVFEWPGQFKREWCKIKTQRPGGGVQEIPGTNQSQGEWLLM